MPLFPVGCFFPVGVVCPVGVFVLFFRLWACLFPVGFCFLTWALFCLGRSQGEVVEGMCLKERVCMWCVIVVVFAFHMSNYHVNFCLAMWIFIYICIINCVYVSRQRACSTFVNVCFARIATFAAMFRSIAVLVFAVAAQKASGGCHSECFLRQGNEGDQRQK